MIKNLMSAGLALLFVPLMQGCEDREVVAGAAVGAVVGGAIVAIAGDDDGYRGRDRYYRSRYDNYYAHRRAHYHRVYRNRYRHRDYSGVTIRYSERRNRYASRGRYNTDFESYDFAPLNLVLRSRDARAMSNFFKLPAEVAAIVTDAKNRAARGDLSGLKALGLGKRDFQSLAEGQVLRHQGITIMAGYLGIERAHAKDILTDFRSEFRAQVAAGRIRL